MPRRLFERLESRMLPDTDYTTPVWVRNVLISFDDLEGTELQNITRYRVFRTMNMDKAFFLNGTENEAADLVTPNPISEFLNETKNPAILGSKTDTDSFAWLCAQGVLANAALNAFRYLVVPYFLLLIACTLWEQYLVNLRDKSSKLPLPNGRMGLPVFGEMFHFLLRGVNFQRGRRRQFGPIYRTHLFGSPTITVIGEKYVRRILLGEGQLVETKWPYTTRIILGTDGIVNGSKETHTRIKRLALRAFSPRFMETYSSSVQRSIKNHVADWKRKGEIQILKECKLLVAKTMMSVLMGVNEDDPKIHEFISAADDIINGILCIPIETPFSALKRGKQARRFIFEQMEKKLLAKMNSSDEELFGEPGFCASTSTKRKNIDEFVASGSRKDSVLVNIIKLARMEGEKEIGLKNLQNLSLEFIFAGTQSLQSSSSMMIMHLSQHPEVLHRLRQEIKEKGLWDRPLEEIPYKQINSLSYTSHVVNEVLRVTPPIPGAIRVAKKTFELGGYQVPKGWQVIYSIRETHEMVAGEGNTTTKSHIPFRPNYFACEKCNEKKESGQDAEKTPLLQNEEDSKSSAENASGDHICHNKNGTFSFIPFGKGARMCAGVNYALFALRVLAIEIARSSDFELVSKVKILEIPMTKPAHSVRVLFKPLDER